MHRRPTTLATRTVRICRMMGFVVVVAMLPTRFASANVPCGDKNAEMPHDLAEVLHNLREEIEVGDTTYFNKLIVPNVYYKVRDPKLFALNDVLEAAPSSLADSRAWSDWSNAIASDCEALDERWVCLSQTETLPEAELYYSQDANIGNVSGTLLKEAPRENSATVALLECRAYIIINLALFDDNGTYWRKASVVGDDISGYVKNDDLVYSIGGSITFSRVRGIWRIVEVGPSGGD